MSTQNPSLFPVPLRKRADFLRIQKNGARWVTPGFVLSYETVSDNDHAALPAAAQIGFTITKKIGNAVVRNRIRRRLRHLTRAILPDLPVQGWRIVLLARHEALSRDYADLGKDLRWAVRKLQDQRNKPPQPDKRHDTATTA